MTMTFSDDQQSTTLPWVRYWCGRDQTFELSHTGYLTPPGESHYRSVNANLRLSEDIVAMPCLVLLGEPGIGKTSEIEGLYRETESALVTGDTIHRINLRSVGSEATLYRELFDHPRFVAWANAPQGTLHLFLDSFDECLLRVETIAALLAENLSQYPAERLFIRIACRTAEWPGDLERALCRLYMPKHDEEPPRIGVYELLPLCEQDVALAAQSQGVETGAFLASVAKTRTTAFASKPVTLFLLLSLYESQGELPASRRDLYYQGCLKLCEETDHDKHRRVLSHRNLTPEQRLIVAARIAAITQFSNRYALLTNLTSSPHSPELITLSDIIGGTETVRGATFEATELVVREALDTGLFTARGESAGLMGWAHQTYAEFLAAWYLHVHHAPPGAGLKPPVSSRRPASCRHPTTERNGGVGGGLLSRSPGSPSTK